jgi:hypothetical protein
MAHNPEVAGSNPAPATSFRRSRPFPSRERAFCVSGTVVKRVVATALRAARQRDGGDGMTRDETAWTRWTLRPRSLGAWPRGTAGASAVSSRLCWTSPKRGAAASSARTLLATLPASWAHRCCWRRALGGRGRAAGRQRQLRGPVLPTHRADRRPAHRARPRPRTRARSSVWWLRSCAAARWTRRFGSRRVPPPSPATAPGPAAPKPTSTLHRHPMGHHARRAAQLSVVTNPGPLASGLRPVGLRRNSIPVVSG